MLGDTKGIPGGHEHHVAADRQRVRRHRRRVRRLCCPVQRRDSPDMLLVGGPADRGTGLILDSDVARKVLRDDVGPSAN